MKSILSLIAAGTLLTAVAAAQPHPRYRITDLGPQSSPFSQATAINNGDVISGLALAPDFTQHAVLWYRGKFLDISQPGLGGPNSGAFGVSAKGEVLVLAESSSVDPGNENFCGYGTGLKCLPALWRNGVMTQLPLLGGNNGSVGIINQRGEATGTAETATVDPECPPDPAVSGTGPQIYDYKPVVWGPKAGEIRELRLPSGDTVGMAFGINESGEVVGMSGTCANTQLPGIAASAHAVLWDKDGAVRDLGNLGGTENPAILGEGNVALSINDRGEVVGTSALKGNLAHHPFLWIRGEGMRDLGLLEGDTSGAGLAINNEGDVVGASVKGPDPISGSPRAAMWRDGKKYDLNDLALPHSPLYLLTAFAINDAGEIVGFGVTGGGDIHGFLATPSGHDK